jgi:acetylornithine deacetylase
MAVATGHKGKTALRMICTGREGHSALAPMALNAIHLASDMIGEIRALQARVQAEHPQDDAYDVPYTTLHAGRIDGGTVVNIVPNRCVVDFEIRNLPEDDPDVLIAKLRDTASAILAPLRDTVPEAGIAIEITNRYPPLGTAPGAEVVQFVKSLTGANGTMKVAFGTEGGLFDTRLGVPTVVCGPGSMAQGHKPDEYVTTGQLAQCDAMLDALLLRLRAGL